MYSSQEAQQVWGGPRPELAHLEALYFSVGDNVPLYRIPTATNTLSAALTPPLHGSSFGSDTLYHVTDHVLSLLDHVLNYTPPSDPPPFSQPPPGPNWVEVPPGSFGEAAYYSPHVFCFKVSAGAQLTSSQAAALALPSDPPGLAPHLAPQSYGPLALHRQLHQCLVLGVGPAASALSSRLSLLGMCQEAALKAVDHLLVAAAAQAAAAGLVEAAVAAAAGWAAPDVGEASGKLGLEADALMDLGEELTG